MAQITVGQYLFERLRQLGVESVFGVPGDYELVLLDMVTDTGLSWKGNPNELNASYAADGYGRIKGVGAVVSTFGPGELSTYAGLGGSYTEYVPVVNIIGYPATTAIDKHLIVHHSLGDGRFGMYHEMAKNITVQATVISKAETAAEDIDRTLNAMLHESRPVYFGIPVDMGPQMVSSAGLKTPLITSLAKNDAVLESEIVSRVAAAVRGKGKTVIIVDGLAVRFRCQEETAALIRAANVPYFTTIMAKGFDETMATFGGVYGGAISPQPVRDAVETADTVIWVGSYSSDLNTGEFTARVRPETIVDLQRHFVTLGKEKHQLNMPNMLKALTAALEATCKDTTAPSISWDPYPMNHEPKPAQLTQDYLWPAIGRALRADDVVVIETGTSSTGIPAADLRGKQLTMFTQTVWGSIGFATGAAVGAFVAAQELQSRGRPVLITGEGSLQLTAQAFADLLRHRVGAVVFLLNNGGYTIERLIHGPDADYNTVPVWDYAQLGAMFGPEAVAQGRFRHVRVRTPDELDRLVRNAEFADDNPRAGVVQVVEVMLGRMDAPRSILDVAKAIELANTAAT